MTEPDLAPKTKAELDQLNSDERQYYFEWVYPYVLPENEVMDVVDSAMTQSLSALENAYVRWMLETWNRELAVEKFMHPAYFFDKANFGEKYLKAKPEITELLKKIRRDCPFLKLYSSDYITGLLHDEIQYLRSRERKERFYGKSADLSAFVGKKTPHDQEMEEIDRLLACLKQIHELKMAAGGFGNPNGNSNGKPGSVDSGIDRVIAGAKELIHRKENGADR